MAIFLDKFIYIGPPLFPPKWGMGEAMARDGKSNNEKVIKMCYKCYFLGIQDTSRRVNELGADKI
ncbi:hypothetical protein D0T57_09405 [Dysgonomonas sp. 511]|nr:hypothetical protein [Dysgonomonas sp. 511]